MPWSINSARSENVEAPGWQGAPSEEYRVYASEAQRSQPGCIGVLIGQYLWTAVLSLRRIAALTLVPYSSNLPLLAFFFLYPYGDPNEGASRQSQ